MSIYRMNKPEMSSSYRQEKRGSGLVIVVLLALAIPDVANAACTTARCAELSKNTASEKMSNLLSDWGGSCNRNYIDTFSWQKSGISTDHHQASDRGEAFNDEIRLFLTHSENEGHIQMFQAVGSDNVGSTGRLLAKSAGARPFLDSHKFDSPSVPHPADMGVVQLTPKTTGGNAAGLVAVVSKDVDNSVDFFSYDFNDTKLNYEGGFANNLGLDGDQTETAAMIYYNGEVLLFLGAFAKNCGTGYYKMYRADPLVLFPNLNSTANPLATVNLNAFTLDRAEQTVAAGSCIGPAGNKQQTPFGETVTFIQAVDGLYLMGTQSDKDGNNDQIGAYKVSTNTDGTYYLSSFSGNYNATNTNTNGRDGPYLHVEIDGTVVHGGSERWAANVGGNYVSRWWECTGN